MAKQKFTLADEQKDAYLDIIAELRNNHLKGKTTRGSIKAIERSLKTLGFTPVDIANSDGSLYFI